jgi:hypothetical protein
MVGKNIQNAVRNKTTSGFRPVQLLGGSYHTLPKIIHYQEAFT